MTVPFLAHLIGGESVAPHSGLWLDNVAPATGEVVSRIARGSQADVDAAVEAAREAFVVWSSTPAADRARVLDRTAALIEERREQFVRAESIDTGKPIGLARRMDIDRAIANFRFFAGALRHMETGFHQMDGAFNYTLRQPLGPVALITPWNLPIYLLSWKTAPALAMGNTIVAKPSELTPTTAHLLAQVLLEAGLPPGGFNLVHGLGPEVGGPLTAHPGIKAVSFTGGTSTGATVARTAAPTFKKLSLELGGKNPTIVFDDADLDLAVQGATRAGFTNTGQICLCGSRLLVQRRIYDRFVEGLVAQVRALRQGDPLDEATELGPVISEAHRDKVESYIDLARRDGGTVLVGGGRPELPAQFARGAWVEPTVITGLAPTCRAATEEIFGPVVTIHAFETEEEAIDIANLVDYGLSASVWTRDLGTAHRVAARLETGMVWVNTWLLRDLRVPFGGVKHSGVGREGGADSLRFFSQDKNVCIRL